nr:uncharacterized protein LOC106692962 [Halyomorpha halys]
MDLTSFNEINQIEPLKGSENFQMWKFKVNIFFKASGAFEVISKDFEPPRDHQSKDYKVYLQNDTKTSVTTVNQRALTLILTCTTASQMLSKLWEIYERDISKKKFDLLQELLYFKFKNGIDLASHISSIENLAFRLKLLGNDISDDMVIFKVLTTLPKKYKYFL